MSRPYQPHSRIPIQSVPWNDDEKPSFNDLSNRLRKTLSRYSRYWSPRPHPMSSSSSVPASSLKFVLLCSLWYTSSALSSNTGKAILMQFKYPVTLTFVQFGFVAAYCLLFMSPLVQFSRIRHPTQAILRSTVPMGMFQVVGHIFSSLAIARIPVSTVHTIKALSPLFTVAAYALLFGVSYSSKTYVSLLPLTIGVMLACSFDLSASNVIGILCAFGSALVFVSSNIFFKKIMPSTPNGMSQQTSSHKLDKLNLLLYSSSMAFVLMIPIWLYYDLPRLLAAPTLAESIAQASNPPPAHSVTYYFFMNGTVHFAQNIIAFVILASTSPVTYSIASLIKRVAVICIAIVWFAQPIHLVQGIGILMTFTGLWMYNNAKGDVERGEKQMRRVEAARDLALPVTKEDARMMAPSPPPPMVMESSAESTGTGPNAGGSIIWPTKSAVAQPSPSSSPTACPTVDDSCYTASARLSNRLLSFPSTLFGLASPPKITPIARPLPSWIACYGCSIGHQFFFIIFAVSISYTT
ncbi:Glucose-6-phosphate phosphate translocator 1 [Mycena indigotica]|uniref:Glucose-6-phosphate phosphate translocator 1 n=1 Tax=Mycena indigotica TaxID=2126181 RepID=A0A8H6T2P1_9AGAR|nr:Glucose-6-phosphate phosphate translocator 1 [Mycena indigotica]KAF7309863.1 Glucose-6-phosphate phosphate translocator 1 [Mycena indigotica]